MVNKQDVSRLTNKYPFVACNGSVTVVNLVDGKKGWGVECTIDGTRRRGIQERSTKER
jgi:hypothetical protein